MKEAGSQVVENKEQVLGITVVCHWGCDTARRKKMKPSQFMQMTPCLRKKMNTMLVMTDCTQG